jgi:hypothetical protein
MVGTVSKNMATKGSNKSEKRRKVFGLSLDQQLMRDIQYLALDQDRYVNDMIAEEVPGQARLNGHQLMS